MIHFCVCACVCACLVQLERTRPSAQPKTAKKKETLLTLCDETVPRCASHVIAAARWRVVKFVFFFFFKELWIWVRYVSKSISCKASFFYVYFVCDFITYLRCADCSDTPMILLFSLIRKFNITKPLQPRGKGISNFQWIGVRYTCKIWFRFLFLPYLAFAAVQMAHTTHFIKDTVSTIEVSLAKLERSLDQELCWR